MTWSREWPGFDIRGIDCSRPSVYGCRRSWNSTRVGPRSTTRPAYITAMRSVRPATTPRSWVMRIMPIDRSRFWVSSRSRICFWMVTSSAVVGSSATSRWGPQARAMAIVTRWRMPPDSWCG